MHCRHPEPRCFLGQPQGIALKLASPFKSEKESIKYRKKKKKWWLDFIGFDFAYLFKLIETRFFSSVTYCFLNLGTAVHSFFTLTAFYPA